MSDRRYRDEEVREIFERASEYQPSEATGVSPSEGLTLEELTRIGQEAGLSPDSVQRAALAIDRDSALPVAKRPFGIPTGVDLVTPLDRPLTDHEWEVMVAELRHTFQAQGHQESLGATRQWRNGNLQVSIEPAAGGYRLRLGTRRGNFAPLATTGAVFVGLGVFIFLVMLLAGDAARKLALPFAMMGMGLGGLGALAASVFPWARLREKQFAAIAERTRLLTSGSAEGMPGEPGGRALGDPGSSPE